MDNFGLFNWNNEIVVSHEIFNSLTSQLSTCTTTFSAFTTRMRHQYLEVHEPAGFLNNTTFNKIWYAFCAAQFPEEHLHCPKCGSEPEYLIADGVSIAFPSTNRTSTLRPPSVPDPNLRCDDVGPVKGSTFLGNHSLRKSVKSAVARARKALVRLQKSIPTEVERAFDLEKETDYEPFKWIVLSTAANALRDEVGISHSATSARSLADLIDYIATNIPLTNYALLFSFFDVLTHLSAHESMLQLCRPMMFEALNSIATSDPITPVLLATARTHIPSFGIFAENCVATFGDVLPFEVKLVFLNLAFRSRLHYASLSRTHIELDTFEKVVDHNEWKSTGACYYKQYRGRPYYGRFKEVGSSGMSGFRWGRDEQGKAGAKADKEGAEEQDPQCQKYYSNYTESRQTGGLMVFWCKHETSVGFHLIPKGEGRNDVFSAVFRHFSKAPSVLVYDFACALGPYCLTREPQFWKDTLFVIDEFHQHDHTKCSSACFLSTYMANDPTLQRLNSSAAECGNAGLARIRKSVRYCRQYQATLLTRHFLIIWNRLRNVA